MGEETAKAGVSHSDGVSVYEPCSHWPVPNLTDQSVRKTDRSEKINFDGTGPRKSILMGPVPENQFWWDRSQKINFYGDWSQKRSFLWGTVPEKVIFMGTGPRISHFYGNRFLEKLIFMATSPRKSHFYGDWSQIRAFSWGPVPEKVIFMATGPRKHPIIIGQEKNN